MHAAAGHKGEFWFTRVLIKGNDLWAKGKDRTVTGSGITVLEAEEWIMIMNEDEKRNGKHSYVDSRFYVLRH